MTQPDATRVSSFMRRTATYFGLGVVELTCATILCLVLMTLNVVNLFHYRFDADEPQHLHVVWSWTRGLVQYRDLFDNHMPLFHVMLSPVAALIGEQTTILFWMRSLLLPAHFLSAWATYKIGACLFSRRIGIWSFILVGFFPGYHFIALEFRPDNLWAPLWFLCLIVLLSGPIDWRRALVAGLFLGLCFGITMKSTVLLISVLLSGGALLLAAREKLNLTAIRPFRNAITFLGATALVPAIIVIFFAAKGVGDAFWECVIRHQFFGHLFQPKQWIFGTLFVIGLPLVIYLARRLLNSASNIEVGFRRAFIALVTCFYFLALRTFWPLIARGDYLPFYPLLFIFLTAALELNRYLPAIARFGRGALPLPAIAAIVELAVLVDTQPLWKSDTTDQTKLLRDVLRLTTPDDYIFDCKGETVFRKRCFRPIFETITRKRIRRGLIPDDAPQRCIATRTCVAATGMMERFSPGTRGFLERNYLPVTDILRVAGVRLTKTNQNATRYDFDVVVPADYEIIAPDGPVFGKLDELSYNGSRFLNSGRHVFESSSIRSELVLIWTRAAERNFSPFPGGFAPAR